LKEYSKEYSIVSNPKSNQVQFVLSRLHPEAMHNVVLWATKVIMQKSLFISMSCDEVTTIDNQSWLFVHVYVTNEW
jgi:hypothetical protein